MRRLIHFSVNLSDFVWRVSDVSDAILFCFFWRIKNWFRIEQFQEFFCGCCFLLFRQNVASLQMRRWKDNIRRNDLTVCVERERHCPQRERERLSRILTKSPPIWTFSHLIDEWIIRQDPRRLSYHAHVNDRIPWPLNCLSHHHHLASCIVSFNELEKLHVQFPDDNKKKKSQRKTSETRNGKQLITTTIFYFLLSKLSSMIYIRVLKAHFFLFLFNRRRTLFDGEASSSNRNDGGHLQELRDVLHTDGNNDRHITAKFTFAAWWTRISWWLHRRYEHHRSS